MTGDGQGNEGGELARWRETSAGEPAEAHGAEHPGVAATGAGVPTLLTGGDAQWVSARTEDENDNNSLERAFGIDYLSLTAKLKMEALGEWSERWFGPLAWEEQSHGYRWWGRTAKGVRGAMLQGENTKNPEWSGVELPGVIADRVVSRVRRATLELDRLTDGGAIDRWRVGRCDVRWDGGEVSPQMLRDAVVAGVARVTTEKRDWRQSSTGDTIYIGKDGKSHNPVVVCVYNMRGYNRVELRVTGRLAVALILQLQMRGGVEWEKYCREVLRGQVEWDNPAWLAVVGAGPGSRLAGEGYRPHNIESNRTYIERTCKALAIYARLHGVAGLRATVEAGAMRLSTRDLAEYGLGPAPRAAYWPVETEQNGESV